MLFVGADISTRKISLAGVSPDDEWCFLEVALPKDDVPGRGLRGAFAGELPAGFWDEVSCVWIEEPFYNRQNPRTYAALSAVKGALADAIPARVAVDVIRPAVWRQEVGIPGNAKRKDAKTASWAWCEKAGLPMSSLTEDLADAACIAWTCLQQSSRAAAA